jgi:cytidine deaminase
MDRMVEQLLDLASAASENAYCPYSNFPVGAAVRVKDGLIFSGCNIENISFGATMCAERVAAGNAIAAGHTEIEAVAIYHNGETMPYPCGMCRQVLGEFGRNISVIVSNGEKTEVMNLSELMPYAFESDEI